MLSVPWFRTWLREICLKIFLCFIMFKFVSHWLYVISMCFDKFNYNRQQFKTLFRSIKRFYIILFEISRKILVLLKKSDLKNHYNHTFGVPEAKCMGPGWGPWGQYLTIHPSGQLSPSVLCPGGEDAWIGLTDQSIENRAAHMSGKFSLVIIDIKCFLFVCSVFFLFWLAS